MIDPHPDSELRARFTAQRRKQEADAPAFAAMVARAHAETASPARQSVARRLNFRRLVYAGGLATAAAVTALLLIPRSDPGEEAFEQAVRAFQTDPALGAWRSPTAGLLDVPGRELISTVPGVGTPR